jgi:transcriptional regulator with XRE-family HTH domain
VLGERLKKLRIDKKLTQEQLGEKINVTKVSISGYENGNRSPDTETLQRLANYFNVSTDYLLGRTDNPNPPGELPALTEKDEKDIAKDLEKIINNLSTDGYAHFDGRSIEELDEEDKELLIASLENSMRLAKRIAKDKFTPKKYKKNE